MMGYINTSYTQFVGTGNRYLYHLLSFRFTCSEIFYVHSDVVYRVRLVVVDLVWDDIDFGHSITCQNLLGRVAKNLEEWQ